MAFSCVLNCLQWKCSLNFSFASSVDTARKPLKGTSGVSRLQVGKKWYLKASSSVKAYQIIKTFLFFSFWRMEEVSVIQHSYWVYNLLPLLIFEERFIASCGNTEYSKGTHWLLDPCLPSIFIKTLLPAKEWLLLTAACSELPGALHDPRLLCALLL